MISKFKGELGPIHRCRKINGETLHSTAQTSVSDGSMIKNEIKHPPKGGRLDPTSLTMRELKGQAMPSFLLFFNDKYLKAFHLI